MTVIAEYNLPADDFVLGRAAVPGVVLELERLLDDDAKTVSYFWASGGTHEKFEESLREEPTVEEFRSLDGVGDREFYRGLCDPAGDTLTGVLADSEAALLTAAGNHERWSIRVAFENGDVLSAFQGRCVDEAGAALELNRLYNPVESPPQVESDMTPRQRETLVTAYEKGYFDIPRKITLVDLATELDVSDQAVSERLRRGESKLIRTHLLEDA